jgi:hypothetical protein
MLTTPAPTYDSAPEPVFVPPVIQAPTPVKVPDAPAQMAPVAEPIKDDDPIAAPPVEQTATMGAPAAVGGGAAPNDLAVRVDAALATTGLAGKGALIVSEAAAKHVPVDMVLAMLQKESSFLSKANTASIANNNPGNLRYAPWEKDYGATAGGRGGFAHFPSVDAGLRAHINLLATKYRKEVDAHDWDALVSRYAPKSENNTALYIQQMKDWSRDWRSKLGL